ncbi:hypothetical protein FSY45_20435 [Comamonas sp. Z1]|uniref:hypothetical protein n=1 Tax=Comamonas TaxID=283 RepID=UPI00103E90D4|nr:MULTISPECIES: hypothetical protein [Comamonas]TYK74204.1 hypothetical protein FSY45_20435 [Comamonas sp. Z1]
MKLLNTPLFWCWLRGHKWEVTNRVEVYDGVDVSGVCERCGCNGSYNEKLGPGEFPKKPKWHEVKRASA